MQTQAQNTNSIRYGSGIMQIDGVNVGLLNKAKLDVKFNVIEIKASNGRLPPKKKIESAILTADLFEIDLTNLQKLDSHGILSSVAGTSTPVTAEVLKTGTWKTNEVVFFAHANGDATAVSSVVLKNATTNLSLGTDYSLVLENGKTGVVRVGADLTLTGIGLNVGYSYTPNVSKTITYSDVIKLVQYYPVSFMNTDENGKKFGITIPKGYSAANITLEFPDDDATDKTLTTPIEVRAFPDSNNVMFTIYDEQAV